MPHDRFPPLPPYEWVMEDGVQAAIEDKAHPARRFALEAEMWRSRFWDLLLSKAVGQAKRDKEQA
jgi:hypothetical protein